MTLIFVTQKIEDSKNIQSFTKKFYKHLIKYHSNVFMIANQNEIQNSHENFYFLDNLLKKKFLINKIFKIFKYYKIIFDILKKHHIKIIFIHQIDIFIFLSYPLKMFGIKIYYWRAHTSHKLKETICYHLSDKIITTNKFTIKTIKNIEDKYIFTGHFISMPKKINNFYSNNNKTKINVILLGRVTKVKNIEKAFSFLNNLSINKNKEIILDIFGPINYTANDYTYYKKLLKIIKKLPNTISINFKGTVKKETIFLNNKYDFSLNFSKGALDKTVIELLNFNIPTFSNNLAYGEELDFENLNNFFYNTNDEKLLNNIIEFLSFPFEIKKKYIKKNKYFVNMNNNIDNTLNIIFNL